MFERRLTDSWPSSKKKQPGKHCCERIAVPFAKSVVASKAISVCWLGGQRCFGLGAQCWKVLALLQTHKAKQRVQQPKCHRKKGDGAVRQTVRRSWRGTHIHTLSLSLYLSLSRPLSLSLWTSLSGPLSLSLSLDLTIAACLVGWLVLLGVVRFLLSFLFVLFRKSIFALMDTVRPKLTLGSA